MSIKSKLEIGFKNSDKMMSVCEKLYRIFEANSPVKPQEFYGLLLEAKDEVNRFVKLKLCAWCGNIADSFKSIEYKAEYMAHGFCQKCQDEEKNDYRKTKKREEQN